jgi:hypothetical protein
VRPLALIACIALSACGGGDGAGTATPRAMCTPPASIPPPADLPPRFPTPDGVVYTSAEKAGPSTILEGYYGVTGGVSIEEAFEAYKAAFADAGYQVPDEEIEAADAEVNFASPDATGQVRLTAGSCQYLGVGVTIRPA